MMLYDADCAFCAKAAARVRRLGVAAQIRPLQSVDLESLGVSRERAKAEMPFVAADGAVTYGHQAFAAALRTGNPVLSALGAALASRPVGALAGPAYRWVAANRGRLPGGAPSCSRVDGPHPPSG
jgi:predicted DCC family thiol-disulfide oxidoreductase YuxK